MVAQQSGGMLPQMDGMKKDWSCTIMSSYENQTMLKAVKDGSVLGFATEYPVIMGRVGVDLAVRALEKKDFEKVLLVAPGIVTKDNVDKIDTTQIFAPDGYRPEFSVK